MSLMPCAAPAAAAGTAAARPRLVSAACESGPLRLAEALCVACAPSQCGALLAALQRDAPLRRGLQHLKRVWRRRGCGSGGADELLVLLWVALDDAATLQTLPPQPAAVEARDPSAAADEPPPAAPPAVAALAVRFGAGPLRRAHVPLLPSSNQADAADWSLRYWPCGFNAAAAAAAAAAAPPAGDALPEAEVAAMQAGMRAARAQAAAAALAGCPANGCVIVNPATGDVIASGADASGCPAAGDPPAGGPPGFRGWAEGGGGSGRHPLSHAVMAALESASRRDLALYNAPTTAQAAAAALRGDCPPPPAKRRAAELQPLQARPPPAEEDQEAQEAPRPYLCTGWDCFVVAEPCLMCAMALVHSRVRRVVYSRRDERAGALGGRWRLQAVRSLNHHYAVYVLED